jgi:hypothetical protein
MEFWIGVVEKGTARVHVFALLGLLALYIYVLSYMIGLSAEASDFAVRLGATFIVIEGEGKGTVTPLS